jgi:hypothetical protein
LLVLFACPPRRWFILKILNYVIDTFCVNFGRTIIGLTRGIVIINKNRHKQ